MPWCKDGIWFEFDIVFFPLITKSEENCCLISVSMSLVMASTLTARYKAVIAGNASKLF